MLGELQMDMGDAAASKQSFTRVLALEPHDAKTRLRLSRVLRAEGAYEDALAVLVPAAESTPNARTLTELAAIYRDLGRADDAVGRLNTAVALNGVYRPAWEMMISALDGLARTHEADAARAALAAIVPKLSTAEVVRRIDEVHPDDAPRFVVNIGCRDGKSWDDPCHELFHQGYPGLAIDAGRFPGLHRNLPQASVRKMLGTMLTPANVLSVLRQGGCPERLSLLKIDIDSFDGVLLQAALRGLRPNVIQIEVNPQIPPPLKFAIHYDPRYKHSGLAGFFGCSLSYVTSICRPLGYELLELDLSDPPLCQDAILVKRTYLDLWADRATGDERALFLQEPAARNMFEAVGADPAAWREQTDDDVLLSQVWDACAAASVKRSTRVLPFFLSL